MSDKYAYYLEALDRRYREAMTPTQLRSMLDKVEDRTRAGVYNSLVAARESGAIKTIADLDAYIRARTFKGDK